LLLAGYNYDIKKHANADGLSRLSAGSSAVVVEVTFFDITQIDYLSVSGVMKDTQC